MNGKSKCVSVWFHPEDLKLYRQLRKLAKEKRRSVSSMVVEIVAWHLKHASK